MLARNETEKPLPRKGVYQFTQPILVSKPILVKNSDHLRTVFEEFTIAKKLLPDLSLEVGTHNGCLSLTPIIIKKEDVLPNESQQNVSDNSGKQKTRHFLPHDFVTRTFSQKEKLRKESKIDFAPLTIYEVLTPSTNYKQVLSENSHPRTQTKLLNKSVATMKINASQNSLQNGNPAHLHNNKTRFFLPHNFVTLNSEEQNKLRNESKQRIPSRRMF